MQTGPAVVVKKGGFLSAIAHGFFGLLTVGVVCLTALGWRAMSIGEQYAGKWVETVQQVLADMPPWEKWGHALPPAIGEPLNDTRNLAYLDDVSIEARLIPGDRSGHRSRVVLEIKNNGDEVVSMLAVGMTFVDDDGVPADREQVYAATPFAIPDEDWSGPIFPGSTRQICERVYVDRDIDDIKLEINELRTWVRSDHTSASVVHVNAARD